MDTTKPVGRRCPRCALDNRTLEFQQHHVERPTDAPGTVTIGTLWKCRACQHAVFIADDNHSLDPNKNAA